MGTAPPPHHRQTFFSSNNNDDLVNFYGFQLNPQESHMLSFTLNRRASMCYHRVLFYYPKL